MMATETDDAFERAAEAEHRLQARRQLQQDSDWLTRHASPLVRARSRLHGTIQALLFLAMAFGVHWYIIQRVTYWVIAHGVIIALTFLGLVAAWGECRVAEAALREREVRD